MSRRASSIVQLLSGGLAPPLDKNWLTWIDADAGPVGTPTTAVGNPLTDWISLDVTGGGGPYNWVQNNSVDRVVLSDTTFSGGRLSADGDGSTDNMLANAMAADLDGDGTAYTRVAHMVIKTVAPDDYYWGFGRTASTLVFDLWGSTATGATWRKNRRGAAGQSLLDTASGGLANGTELVIVEVFSGSTFTSFVNGVKIHDNVPHVTGNETFDICSIFAWNHTTITNATIMGLRRFGIRLGTITPLQVGTIYSQLYDT